jgi:hypothetical protein
MFLICFTFFHEDAPLTLWSRHGLYMDMPKWDQSRCRSVEGVRENFTKIRMIFVYFYFFLHEKEFSLNILASIESRDSSAAIQGGDSSIHTQLTF